MAIKHEQMNAILADSSYDMFFEEINIAFGSRLESITDGTLKSTARMLFLNRRNETSVAINVDKTNYKIQQNNINYLLEYMGNYDNRACLQVWYYPTNLEELTNNWKEVLGTSGRFKINEVMSRWINGLVIDSPSHTTIFVPSLSIRKDKALEYFHRIVAGLPQYEIFKPLFKDKPLSENELVMLKSLTEDGNGWTAYEQQFFKDVDIERMKIEKLVGNFANNPMDRLAANRLEEVQRISRDIDQYRERIRRLIPQLEEAQILHVAAMEKAKTAPDINKTIGDFFLNNKNVTIERKQGDKLYFIAKAALSVYDTDTLENYIKNPNSMLYEFRGFGDEVTFDVAKAFYTKVFIDRLYRIDGIAKWWINPNAHCDKAQEQRFTNEERKHAMPNPHLYHFICIGRHRDLLSQAEQDVDFEQAMLVAVQSTSSLNWNDGAVISRFVNDIWSNNNKIYWDEANKEFVNRNAILKEITKEIMANEKA